MSTTASDAAPRSNESRGLLLAFAGVLIFSLTLPVTRIAVAELTPWFITVARAALAGVLALVTIGALRLPKPASYEWWPLALSALGIVYGFPLFMAWALQYVPASHGAVVSGLLPLATAVAGAFVQRHRPSMGFWLCAVAGSAIIVAFALVKGAGHFQAGDLLMLLAVITCAIGYAYGGNLSRTLGGLGSISWALVITLPFNLALTWWLWPTESGNVSTKSWLSLVWLGVMSMYLGFVPWYRGLALAGVARASQVQLLQLFLALGFAALLVGERVGWQEVVFGALVAITVFVGRKMPIYTGTR